MNLSLFLIKNQKIQKSNYQRTKELTKVGALLSLSMITSFISLILPFNQVAGFLSFDLGFVFFVIALYFTNYWMVFLIAIIHGTISVLFSKNSNWVGGMANAMTTITLITIWWLLVKGLTIIKKNSCHEKSLMNIVSLIIMIVITTLGTACVMVVLNKYLFLHLYGADSWNNFHFLWEILFPFNLINILLNVSLFLFLKPIIYKIYHS